MRGRRRRRIVAGVLAIGVVVAACGSDDTDDAQPASDSPPARTGDATDGTAGDADGGSGGDAELTDATLTVGIGSDIGSLDPHSVAGTGGGNLPSYGPMFGGDGSGLLVLVDPETKEWLPGVARSWKMSEDGMTWTFKLRDDVKFHNGEQLTSEDVKFTIDRIIGQAEYNPDYVSGFRPNFEPFVKKVDAPDPLTVIVHMKQPNVTFPIQYLYFVPKEYVEEVGDEGFAQAPVGIGAFKFVSWEPGNELVLERFDDYYLGMNDPSGWHTPYVKTLVQKVIPDNAARLAAVQAGEIDLAHNISADIAKQMDGADDHDIDEQVSTSRSWWHDWAAAADPSGPYRDAVTRSLLVLRALTHDETGGIVAAATTSLPEDFGGSRNWDYRYVWLRDASLTLEALMVHGFDTGIERWRQWLLRAIAGDPADVQIMYGLAGERGLAEQELDCLPGYEGAAPVRIGNAASLQFQADVIGEVMVALHAGREAGVTETDFSWSLQRALLAFLEKNWQRPDQGIWEIRGEPHAFTHSRTMVWAAFDRAVKAVNDFGLDGPVKEWAALRDEIRAEIESKGFDSERNTFVQYYGSTELDASLLQLAQVGFVAPDDPRMLGTVAAIEKDLVRDGLLLRYRTEKGVDGLPGDENPFLACSFWLVEQYAWTGRLDEARRLMDRLVGFANDVGLLSEEYDVTNDRQAGNTPQAFSHLGLVRAADAIAKGESMSKA